MTKASEKKAGRAARESAGELSVSALRAANRGKRGKDTTRDAASITSRAKASAPQCGNPLEP